MQNSFKNLATIILSVLFTLLAIELSLRVYYGINAQQDFKSSMRTTERTTENQNLSVRDIIKLSESQDLIYDLAPGVSGHFKNARIEINGQGNRGKVVPYSRNDPRSLRIVGLGDSVMFGWGVEENETFLSQVSDRTKQDWPDVLVVETINLGVPGYNTAQEVESFATKGLEYKPDIAVLLIVNNDLFLPQFLIKGPVLWGFDQSFLFDLVSQRISLLMGQESEIQDFDPPRIIGAPHPTVQASWNKGIFEQSATIPEEYTHLYGVEAYTRALKRFSAICKRENITPIVFHLRPNNKFGRMTTSILDLIGLETFELEPYVVRYEETSGNSREGLAISKTDRHPTATYHGIFAKAFIAEFLIPWLKLRSSTKIESVN